MPFLYEIVKIIFQAASSCFYASFDVRGTENIPEDQPTILCFNHGNSLGDPVVLISCFPSFICFCAKHTLWKAPGFGHLVRASGALPIFRKKDQSVSGNDKSRVEFNAATFSAVYQALQENKTVAFAPEGISKFLSYAAKFRSGVGFIALETLMSADQEDFTVNILPTCMTFTHREKFRSDVLVRYLKPIRVNKKYLEKNGFSLEDLKNAEKKKTVAFKIKEDLEKEFHEYLISSPDWESVKLAIAATRVHRPLGTLMSLSRYILILKGWLELIKSQRTQEKETPLVMHLRDYQNILDKLRLKDERFNRLMNGKKMRSTLKVFLITIYRSFVALSLFILCAPGLALWSPVWFLLKKNERYLLSKGETWVDSLAEHKMMYGFFGLVGVLGLVWINKISIPLTIIYLWFTVRAYEEMVACVRSLAGVLRLWWFNLKDPKQIEAVVEARRKLKQLIGEELAKKRFSSRVREEILAETDMKDDIYKLDPPEIEQKHSNWQNFNIFRRRKKDWNELLRLSDYCTMDYVE
eukprot:maker-scaffold_16-snap-gene-6.28-mRNA-1 protein AED:0.01 eAED:0.01 QI:116/1/1/1/1/1/3/28/523